MTSSRRRPGPRPTRRGASGLTLIEIAIAAALLSAVAASFLSGLRLSTLAARSVQQGLIAESLVRELFAQTQAQGFEQARSRRGSFEPEFPGMLYELDVRPTALRTLRSIHVTVRWEESGHARMLSVDGALADRRARLPAPVGGGPK